MPHIPLSPWAYALWAMNAEKELIDRYQIPADKLRQFQGRGDLDKPKLKLVAAVRKSPNAAAEGSQLSKWWRKAGATCMDIAFGLSKGMAITSKFLQDRFRPMKKLRMIKCNDDAWKTWVTRVTAEW